MADAAGYNPDFSQPVSEVLGNRSFRTPTSLYAGVLGFPARLLQNGDFDGARRRSRPFAPGLSRLSPPRHRTPSSPSPVLSNSSTGPEAWYLGAPTGFP